MLKVADLSADEAATRADEIWNTPSKRKAALQLVYYALSKDENCQMALTVLCRWCDTLFDIHVAIAVIEYVWSQIKDEQLKQRVLFYRRMELNTLGLISHPDGTQDLPMEVWRTSDAFVIDEAGLRHELQQLNHTPREMFQAVKILYGVRGGLLISKTKSNVELKDCFNANDFEKSHDYSKFLAATELQETSE